MNTIRIPTTMRPVLREDIVAFEQHYAKHVIQYYPDEVPGYEVTEHSADEVEEIELPCFLREQA